MFRRKAFLRNIKPKFKVFKRVKLILFILTLFLVFVLFKHINFKSTVEKWKVNLQGENYPFATKYERKDWHDWNFVFYERTRTGPGEHGMPVQLTDPKDIETNAKLFEIEGLNAVVSDIISVNRSVPDTRLPQ